MVHAATYTYSHLQVSDMVTEDAVMNIYKKNTTEQVLWLLKHEMSKISSSRSLGVQGTSSVSWQEWRNLWHYSILKNFHVMSHYLKDNLLQYVGHMWVIRIWVTSGSELKVGHTYWPIWPTDPQRNPDVTHIWPTCWSFLLKVMYLHYLVLVTWHGKFLIWNNAIDFFILGRI